MVKETHQAPVRLVKGVFVPSTQTSFPRNSWPRRVRTVCPQWLYQPWPQLWISPSNLIGPVSRALCYFLGQDLKQNNELVCLPLERFLTRPLSCHYLLMDQATVILCYELSGQEGLTLHQVKPHVVRAPCCF